MALLFWLGMALAACLIGLIAWLILGTYVIARLSLHPLRKAPLKTPDVFGAEYEDIQFPSFDGARLSGWFVPARVPDPRGVVILCHGMSANRSEVLPWAKPLWESGFALLMFDFRRLGESEGEFCTAGHFETHDLLAAVDYVKSRPEIEPLPVGVFGFSMGGVAAIRAAAEDDRIKAVATHGAFATLERALRQRCRHHFGPMAPLAAWMTRRFVRTFGWDIAASSGVDPLEAVRRLTPRPLLLLHGKRDPIVHVNDARDLHRAAGYPKELNLLPRSGHRRIHPTIQPAAWESLRQFFCDTLGRSPSSALL